MDEAIGLIIFYFGNSHSNPVCHYYPHFTNEETEAYKRLEISPKVRSETRVWNSHLFDFKALCCDFLVYERSHENRGEKLKVTKGQCSPNDGSE